jgi:hypothetical protein
LARGMATGDSDARGPAAGAGPTLTTASPPVWLMIAGRVWAVPVASVRTIAEAEPVTPLPIATPWVEGLANVNDRPVVRVDLAAALGLGMDGVAASGAARRGRVVAVVATIAGDVALRVDDARWAREDGAPVLELAELLPWCGGFRVDRAGRAGGPAARFVSVAGGRRRRVAAGPGLVQAKRRRAGAGWVRGGAAGRCAGGARGFAG